MVRSGASVAVRRAVAFAPGHVTGVFAPDLAARDPRARGSRGAGLVLSAGAHARVEWTPGRARRVTVAGDVGPRLPISEEVARRLLPVGRRGHLAVRLTHELPVGQGFGMSAAGALATAYGVAKVFGLPRRRAVDVAHLAELFGGGGLGGVAAILGGGLELRLRPGVPPFGSVVRRSFPGPILLGVLAGPLPTRRVLQNPDFLRRFASTGDQLLAGRRTLARRDFLEMSERFTDEVRLAPPPVRSVVRALRKDGGWAAQAMFGRSVFAAPRAPGSWTRIVRDLRRSATRVFEVTAHPVHPGRTDLPATDGARAPRRA